MVGDSQRWDEDCITPLKVAPTPESIVAGLLAEDVQRYLDYLIEQQTPEGPWNPEWTSGGFYPEVWPVARQEWRGQLTLEYLTSIRAWGRLVCAQ